jgi:hypothetical protein
MDQTTSFKVLTVEHGKDGKPYYTQIGRAWPLKEKDGCAVRLSALPVNGELIVLPRPTKQEGQS